MNDLIINLTALLKEFGIFFRENRDIIYISLAIVMLFVERWFGKTSKTPASSVLEWLEMKITGNDPSKQVFDFPAAVPVKQEESKDGKSI